MKHTTDLSTAIAHTLRTALGLHWLGADLTTPAGQVALAKNALSTFADELHCLALSAEATYGNTPETREMARLGALAGRLAELVGHGASTSVKTA